MNKNFRYKLFYYNKQIIKFYLSQKKKDLKWKNYVIKIYFNTLLKGSKEYIVHGLTDAKLHKDKWPTRS